MVAELKQLHFVSKTVEEVLVELGVDRDGLSSKEAADRLQQNGPNSVPLKSVNGWQIFSRNFYNAFNLILLGAGFLSFLLEGLQIETILILAFFLLALLIAYIQDYRATKLTEKLLSFFKNYARVKRDGSFSTLFQSDIVVGDWVRVEAGEIIPADMRVVEIDDLLIDESILTGESLPVTKLTESIREVQNVIEARNLAFTGTMVVRGYLEGIVIATGKETYFGSLAKTTLEVPKETSYQRMVDQFAKLVSYVVLVVMVLIVIFNFLKPTPIPLRQLIVFVIVAGISIIPEFLPTVSVLVLSLSAFHLAKRGLVLKRLSGIEDLGAIEILAVDKTGTLTKNSLTFKDCIADDKSRLLEFFLLPAIATGEPDPYEAATLKAVPSEVKQSIDSGKISLIEDKPFDPHQRLKTTTVMWLGKQLTIIKGAPEDIIPRCDVNQQQLQIFLEQAEVEDKKGFRTVAVAVELEAQPCKYIGIVTFEDPLKESAKKAIANAKLLNLRIKILTGDAPYVAEKVARELGLLEAEAKEKIITGPDIRRLTDEELEAVIENKVVFARVLPEDKLRLLRLFQKRHFVGFLGEGINDLPGLKIANLSMVVDTATDAAKQESDLLLRQKDLEVVVTGVLQGRKSLENIGKYLKHTMSDNFGNLFSVSFLSLLVSYVPLLPTQVLLTNLITDIPLFMVASDVVDIHDIRRPLRFSTHSFFVLLSVLGFVAAAVNLATYVLVQHLAPEQVRTALFLETTLTGLIVMFSIRTKNWFFLSRLPSLLMLGSLLLGLAMLIIVFTVPIFRDLFQFVDLPAPLYFQLSLLAVTFLFLTELAKYFFYKLFPETI